jgi:hypothetical protein
MLFKKRLQAEFVDFIHSVEGRPEFVDFLGSAEGRRAIFALAPDILVNSKLSPILDDVRAQLTALAADEIAQFTLQLEKILDTAKDYLANFLCSQQGTRLLLDILIEALARGELAPVLDSTKTRLKTFAFAEVATRVGQAEISLRETAAAHAATFKQSANKAARDLANQAASDVQRQLSSYRGTIAEVLREQLPITLREEVARHVGSGPLFSRPCSNRALAAAHGISIREVKRRRRNGYF